MKTENWLIWVDVEKEKIKVKSKDGTIAYSIQLNENGIKFKHLNTKPFNNENE